VCTAIQGGPENSLFHATAEMTPLCVQPVGDDYGEWWENATDRFIVNE